MWRSKKGGPVLQRARAAEARLGGYFGVLLSCDQQKSVRLHPGSLQEVRSFAGPKSPAGEGVGNNAQ